MINEKYSIAMSETLYYLKGIDQEDINKIPTKFMKFLKDNASPNYVVKFDYNKPLKELNLTNEAKGLIAMICLNYWCETEEQKNRFRSKLNENELKYEEELKKRYNPDDIFKKKERSGENLLGGIEKNIQLVEYKDKKWYENLFERILRIFKKN